MRRFGDPRRRSWASDHERARQRAAEQLSLPLPAAEAAWLAEHLRLCPSCARVAAQYASHRDQLRRLRPVDPPRDLWARTSAAFDRVDREFARRETANGSGPLTRHGVRSRNEALRNLRALRSERHATALARFRSVRRPNMPAHVHAARRTPNHGWALPFAALAAFTVMVATGGGLLLTVENGPLSNGLPASSGQVTAALSPGATPITVGPGEVAWLTPNASGGYSLNLANVEHVCPDQALPDCAPLAGEGPHHLPSLAVQPGTVVQSPSKGQLVVVDKSAKGSGGSVYVVAVPARVETPEPTPTPSPTPTPTSTEGATHAPTETVAAATTEPVPSEQPAAPELAATPEPSVEASPSSEPASTTEPTASSEPTASFDPAPSDSAAASPFASLDVTPAPSADGGQTLAIISDVVMVGESAAYSPDGTMFAFSARPADGRHGSDIYVWRVGEPQAHAITTDHASIFSGWIGGLLVGSRPSLSAGGVAEPSGVPVTEAPVASPSESPAVADPNAATETAVARTDHAGDFGDAATGPGPAAADASGAVAGPASWQVTTSQAFRAFVALISPSQDPAATAEPSPSADAGSPAEAPAAGIPAAEPAAIPVSFLIDPSSGVEQPLGGVPAWRPVVDPTGRVVVYWSGALRHDAATASWVPAAGQLFLAAWGDLVGTSAVSVAAVPLLPGDPNGSPSGDWDIRWDTTGTHLAVWIADGVDPSIGRLSLLAVDPTAVPLAVPTILLHDAPGLAGFSIGDDRLAWATPPGQDGEGSHLQVLAWSGENAGQIVSEPASGSDAVIVVR